jgi:hypothetical protein
MICYVAGGGERLLTGSLLDVVRRRPVTLARLKALGAGLTVVGAQAVFAVCLLRDQSSRTDRRRCWALCRTLRPFCASRLQPCRTRRRSVQLAGAG